MHAVAVERGLVDGGASAGAVAVHGSSSHEDTHETDPQVDLLARAAVTSDVLGQEGDLVEKRVRPARHRGQLLEVMSQPREEQSPSRQ